MHSFLWWLWSKIWKIISLAKMFKICSGIHFSRFHFSWSFNDSRDFKLIKPNSRKTLRNCRKNWIWANRPCRRRRLKYRMPRINILRRCLLLPRNLWWVILSWYWGSLPVRILWWLFLPWHWGALQVRRLWWVFIRWHQR